jgi:hypothetical protein
VPSRTKYGDMPNEVLRWMMRMCCGRYDPRIPRSKQLVRTSVDGR